MRTRQGFDQNKAAPRRAGARKSGQIDTLKVAEGWKKEALQRGRTIIEVGEAKMQKSGRKTQKNAQSIDRKKERKRTPKEHFGQHRAKIPI